MVHPQRRALDSAPRGPASRQDRGGASLRLRPGTRVSLGLVRPGRKPQLPRRTLCLPPRVVEYVIVHELVHLVEPHHGPGFWRRVERVIPDIADRKRWLAENGGRY
jgi:Protein of unknown function DUF45